MPHFLVGEREKAIIPENDSMQIGPQMNKKKKKKKNRKREYVLQLSVPLPAILANN